MLDLTSANSVIQITIPLLFPIPQQLQGFSAEDIFDTEDIKPTESMMGCDGILSSGFTPTPYRQTYSLMGDSASNDLFEAWHQAQKVGRKIYYANAVIVLPSLAKEYTMTRGSLDGFKPTPRAAKIIQPRSFAIIWQSVDPSNII